MKRLALKKIRHHKGFEYLAQTNHPGLSSHRTPSSAVVLENGKPLPGPANSVHTNIRNVGSGYYSLWFGTVHFSTSDNSDPRTNGRLYFLEYDEREESRLGSLERILYAPTKLIHLSFLPVWLRNILMEVRYAMESFGSLGLALPFWSLYYWLCFIYVAVRRDRD
jgi:hypothetical protein